MALERVFFDTNVLFYALDISALEKHETAKELVRRAWERHFIPVISVQVLQELFVNLEKKLMNAGAARAIVMDYLVWQVVENTRQLFVSAIDIMETHRLSFWDASIVAAARSADAPRLLSEDLNHGQRYGQVEVENPFKAPDG
jgi:predicted nucleic acid-binding protein